MSQSFILFSGPIAVGKSTVAGILIEEFGFQKIKTGSYLRRLATDRGIPFTRSHLQNLGDQLDKETGYRWVIDEVVKRAILDNPIQKHWIVDAVRKTEQVKYFKQSFPEVLHVHFFAAEHVLKSRYLARIDENDREGGVSYETAISHTNEKSARSLMSIGDICIDLEGTDPTLASDEIYKAIQGT